MMRIQPMDDMLDQIKPFLRTLGLAAVVVGVVLILLRQLRQWYYRAQERKHPKPVQNPAAEDGDEDGDLIPLARTAVRKWKVSGVEKASGNDATWFIDAESRANAKVKAELKGMIVTAVERAATGG